MKKILVAISGLALVAGTSGCSSGTSSDTVRPNVGVSNQIYADLVRELQGVGTVPDDPDFDTFTILDSQTINPHDFEPSAKHRLLVANADLVIFAGTEWDQYIYPLVESVGLDLDSVLSEASVRPLTACGTETCFDTENNPHIWYNLEMNVRFAKKITAAFTGIQPDYKNYYDKALRLFLNRITKIKTLEEEAASKIGSNSYFFAPEAVANSTLISMGLKSANPYDTKFANDVELSTKEMLNAKKILASGKVKIFAANKLVSSQQADELRKYAESVGIPVHYFSETAFGVTSEGDATFTGSYLVMVREIAKTLGITLTSVPVQN